jgi:hypothetical protein
LKILTRRSGFDQIGFGDRPGEWLERLGDQISSRVFCADFARLSVIPVTWEGEAGLAKRQADGGVASIVKNRHFTH